MSKSLAFNQNKKETTQNLQILFPLPLTLIVTKYGHKGGAMLIKYAYLLTLHVVCRFDQYVSSLTMSMVTSHVKVK